MKVTKAHGELNVVFERRPKIKTRTVALKILNLLIKADYVMNEGLALEAIRAAIKKGIA
jgi:hypothetical protein